ncbi:MAG: hypothetical protein JST76_13520 [Bacteroidetes bacterium]|nr:hypothetical protein [Bacteroidota bacterium]
MSVHYKKAADKNLELELLLNPEQIDEWKEQMKLIAVPVDLQKRREFLDKLITRKIPLEKIIEEANTDYFDVYGCFLVNGRWSFNPWYADTEKWDRLGIISIEPIEIASQIGKFVRLTLSDNRTLDCAIESYNEETRLVKYLKVDKVIAINQGWEEPEVVNADENNFGYISVSSIRGIQDYAGITNRIAFNQVV